MGVYAISLCDKIVLLLRLCAALPGRPFLMREIAEAVWMQSVSSLTRVS
jgi:hypothetical protein